MISEQEQLERDADDVIAAWIDRQRAELGADDDDTPCWNCEDAGCDVCDGTPLTDEEIAEQ